MPIAGAASRWFRTLGTILAVVILNPMLPVYGQNASATIGPSFNCQSTAAQREPLAQLICSDPELARLELAFVQAFQALLHQVGEAGRRTLRAEAGDFQSTILDRCRIPSAVPPGRAGVGAAAPIWSAPAAKPCVAGLYRTQRQAWMSRLGDPARQEADRPLEDHIALQSRLLDLGYLPTGSRIDGNYGSATRAAIAAWQRSAGIVEDGFLSSQAAARLNRTTAGSTLVDAARTGAAAPAQDGGPTRPSDSALARPVPVPPPSRASLAPYEALPPDERERLLTGGHLLSEVCSAFGADGSRILATLITEYRRQFPGTLREDRLNQMRERFRSDITRRGGCRLNANELALVTQWRGILQARAAFDGAHAQWQEARARQEAEAIRNRPAMERAERQAAERAAQEARAAREEKERAEQAARVAREEEERARQALEQRNREILAQASRFTQIVWARFVDGELECRRGMNRFIITRTHQIMGAVNRPQRDGDFSLNLPQMDVIDVLRYADSDQMFVIETRSGSSALRFVGAQKIRVEAVTEPPLIPPGDYYNCGYWDPAFRERGMNITLNPETPGAETRARQAGAEFNARQAELSRQAAEIDRDRLRLDLAGVVNDIMRHRRILRSAGDVSGFEACERDYQQAESVNRRDPRAGLQSFERVSQLCGGLARFACAQFPGLMECANGR